MMNFSINGDDKIGFATAHYILKGNFPSEYWTICKKILEINTEDYCHKLGVLS